MSVAVFVVVGITVAVAAFVQGATGMGFALIAAPVVTLADPTLVPVMLLVLMLPLTAYVAVRERAGIDWRAVRWISVGRFAGTFGGVWILLLVNLHQLALVIGWSTILGAVVALLAPAFDPSRAGLGAAGLITGITETATGVGGPPLVLALHHQPGPSLRPTVAACFFIGQAMSLVALAVAGAITAPVLTATATWVPFLVIGAFASRYVHHRLDGPVLRYLVLGFAIVSGAVVLATA